MKKFISITLFFGVISIFISCSNEIKKVNDEEVIGDVKEITYVSYNSEEKFGELLNYDEVKQDDIDSYTKNEFNEDGFVTFSTHYSGLGIIEEKHVTYFKSALPFKREIFKGSNEEQTAYEEVIYEDGLLKEENRFNMADVLQEKVEWLYNEQEEIVEVNNYNQDGKLTSKEKHYHISDDSLRVISYSDNGEYDMDWYRILNDRGEVESYKYRFNEDGDYSLINHKVVERDNKGNWIEKHVFNNEGELLIITEREIQYFDGTVSGDVEIISMKDNPDKITDVIKKEMSPIVSSAQSYFVKPQMIGGGGRSFEGFSFENVSEVSENYSNRNWETDIATYKLIPMNQRLLIIAVSKLNDIVIKGTIVEDDFRTEEFNKGSDEIQRYLD